jgi:hypothetical protein
LAESHFFLFREAREIAGQHVFGRHGHLIVQKIAAAANPIAGSTPTTIHIIEIKRHRMFPLTERTDDIEVHTISPLLVCSAGQPPCPYLKYVPAKSCTVESTPNFCISYLTGMCIFKLLFFCCDDLVRLSQPGFLYGKNSEGFFVCTHHLMLTELIYWVK